MLLTGTASVTSPIFSGNPNVLVGGFQAINMLRSTDYRSTIRPSAACSVRTAGAVDRSSVVGLFANHRSPIGASAARTIDTINASSSIGLMGYNKPAKQDN
jgi:hypothetical protein